MKKEIINNVTPDNIVAPAPLSPAAAQNGSCTIESSALSNQPDDDAEEEQEEQRFLRASVSALDHKLHPSNRHRRVGKIARLPYEVREMVNAMIRGGFRYIDIVARLREQGYTHINENNLS